MPDTVSDSGPASDSGAALDELHAALTAGSYEHRVLTVVHRWYTGYETERRRLDHHGELVTEDFVAHRPAESALPDVQGRQAYLDGLATAYPGQSNAHHLRSVAIERTGADTARAVVAHDFETIGPTLNGAAVLRYDLELHQQPTERLPRISTFAEQILAPRDAPFTEALAENRVLAFLHYWLALLEQPTAPSESSEPSEPAAPSVDVEPLRELLHPELVMTLSDGRVLHTFDQVAAWYTRNAEQVEISTHHLIDPVITPGQDGDHQLTVDFAWQGITRAAQPMTARTRHVWTLAETGERYLRLKRFHVDIVEPFTPTTADQALAHHDAARKLSQIAPTR